MPEFISGLIHIEIENLLCAPKLPKGIYPPLGAEEAGHGFGVPGLNIQFEVESVIKLSSFP